MALGSLDSALSGLRVAQQQLDVIANNVANVGTPGFTRKTLPQATVNAGGETIGVRGETIIRNVNLDLARDFWTQVSNTRFFEVQQKILNTIQQFHGPPDSELSIAAKITELRDSFSALSTTPDELFLIQSTVNQAVDTANKINDFADLITQMRNDAQDEIQASVDRTNDLLTVIADLNQRIKVNSTSGKTIAALEDERDNAIRKLSEEIEITFFTRGDGVMVVQTNQGVQLADERAESLFFNASPIGPQSAYISPGNANNSISGIFIGGNPANNPVAFDITASSPNGLIGSLIDMRDNVLPQHTAQLDELSYRMASRFESQGIRLFTNAIGIIPSDSAANIIGTVDVIALAPGAPLSTAGGAPYGLGTDAFSITIDPNGAIPQTINIDLSTAEANFPSPPLSGAQSLVNEINAQISSLPSPLNTTLVSLNAANQIVINSQQDINIDASGAGEMGTTGLAFLGLSQGTTNAAPTISPVSPVPYVGFSSEIQVNDAVINDNTLIRRSTIPGVVVQDGSNEFIRRVVEFVFGDLESQQAQGGIDLRVSGIPDTLQNIFGLDPQAQLLGSVDLLTLGAAGTLSAAAGNPFLPPSGPPILDSFTLQFDAGGALDTGQIDINLSAAEAFSALPNGADKLVDYINNSVVPALGPPLNAQISASLNPFGQLIINSQVDITVGNGTPLPAAMGDDGLAFLGLSAGTIAAQSPSFDIQIGKDNPVTVTIDPGDTEITLLTKLNAIPGVDATINASTGFLNIRPGAGFGGDLKLVAVGIQSAGGNSVLQELFGATDPIIDIPHQSFRENNLGPNASISTRIIGADNLVTFAQKMISKQTETAILTETRLADERTFRDILQRQLLDESGVNIEEELSNMIIVQTAFSAAARVVQASDEMLQELVNIIR